MPAACTPTRCTCPLDGQFGASHWAEDVLGLVEGSIRNYMHDADEPDMAQAASDLLGCEGGLDEWEPPARQAHRAGAWREACRKGLRGYCQVC